MTLSGSDVARLSATRAVIDDCRISAVEPIVLAGAPEPGSGKSWQRGATRSIVVRVRSECGAEGFGTAESQPEVVHAIVVAEPQLSFSDEALATLGGLRTAIVGCSAANLEPLWQTMYEATLLYGRRGAALQAISAVDIACTDLLARYLGVSVSQLLGGRFRDAVPTYASAVLPDRSDDARTLAAHVGEMGFHALKVGWGAFRGETAEILALLDEIRSKLPASIKLIFDIGYQRRRTATETIRLIRELERYDPMWVEEPCHPDDLETYRKIVPQVSVPIAAGEAYATIFEFTDLLATGVEIIQPDLSRCGGFTVARRVAGLATDANRLVVPHAWQNDLLLAATLNFCAALPRKTFLEYSVAVGPLREICKPRLELIDGSINVPLGPGVGVTPDPDLLQCYRVDPDSSGV